MLSTSLMSRGSSSPSNDRIFIYEVAGIKQNYENDSNRYPFRTSSNVFLKVPYSRMNEQMRRIGLIGGTIVNITPFEASESSSSND